MRSMTEPTGLDSLTAHQRDILRLYIEEGSYRAVAHRLGIAENTVKGIASEIFRRLDVQTITAACIQLDRAER